MLELYYNFFTKFGDVIKIQDLEMDTNSRYLALAEKELEVCIRPEMKAQFEQLRTKMWIDSFNTGAVGEFFPRMWCDEHKKPSQVSTCSF